MLKEGCSSLLILANVVYVISPSVAMANQVEAVAYSYDARGRLVKVERSGSVNNGVKTEYSYDKAGNRIKVKTTGAP